MKGYGAENGWSLSLSPQAPSTLREREGYGLTNYIIHCKKAQLLAASGKSIGYVHDEE
jgi:hypothetical protein